MDDLTAAAAVVEAFKAMRDGTSDELWDKYCDNPLMDHLLTVLMDLETEIDSELEE